MNFRKIVERGYEEGDYAGEFRASSLPDKQTLRLLNVITGALPSEGKILDFGCGTRKPVDLWLAKNGFAITGMDISQKHIDSAKENVPAGKFLKGDFSAFDFGRRRFDAIISLYAIFHIPRAEHKMLFAKMAALLKKDGLLLVTLGSCGVRRAMDKNWCGALMVWSSYFSHTYRRMLRESGFSMLHEEFEGNPGDAEHHYWVLAQKTTASARR